MSDTNPNDDCPICLEALPVQTFRGTERTRILCCGKNVCATCASNLHKTTRSLVHAAATSAAAGGTGLESAMENLNRAEATLSCPMCRTKLPVTEKDRFELVKSRVDQHCNSNSTDWAWADCKLAKYYETGVGCRVDPKKALLHYTRAAKQGNDLAQHELGNIYRNGKGVQKSADEAALWYEKAATQGYAYSQHHLGDILRERNQHQEAARLFTLSAEQGNHYAQCDLAFCYEHGEGVERSLEKSLYWNKKAARQGNATAMMNYGANLFQSAQLKYGDGGIVGHSVVPEALHWARKAALLGDSDAVAMVTQLEAFADKECGSCKAPSGAIKLSRCAQCSAVSYCSKACQTSHWKAGHKWDCCNKAGEKKARPGAPS